MGQASYKTPCQASRLRIRHGARGAALAALPYPRRRRSRPWHSTPRRARLPAAVSPGQHKEVWQRKGRGNRQRPRQRRQAQVGNVSRFRQLHNRAGRGGRSQRQQVRGRKRYFKRDRQPGRQQREKRVKERCLCPSSSNGCRRHQRRGRFPARGPQRKQPGRARWQDCSFRRSNQHQRRRTKPHRQEQAGRQRSRGRNTMVFWNMKKHCKAATLWLSKETLQEVSTRLRPMNMAGFCLQGQCAPCNTSQYIMDQHEYPWKSEEEAAAAMSGGSGDYSTADEDVLLMDPLPSTAQEDEGTSAKEEEEESAQPAWQGWECQDDTYYET